MRNAIFISSPINPIGSIFGRRHRPRVRPRSPLRPILCYGTPFLEVNRKSFPLWCLHLCPTPCHLRASIWPRVRCPTSELLLRHPNHRHPSNVASSTNNPIMMVAIMVHDIVMMDGIMKADTAHATDKMLETITDTIRRRDPYLALCSKMALLSPRRHLALVSTTTTPS